MHRFLFALTLLAASATAGLAATPACTLPPTCAGAHAKAWLEAFASGDDAMRAFYTTHTSDASLAARPMDARLERYRTMKADMSVLTPVEVISSSEDQLVIHAKEAGGDDVTLSFGCESPPSRAFAGVRIERGGPADGDGGPSATPPAPGAAPLSDAESTAKLKARLDALAAKGEFSGAVLLARGGQVIAREARGEASREAHAANRIDTKFNLGSINKIFTRTAIEQLAAAGKLKLGDTVERFGIDYPADKAKRLTVEQLLEHRAGTGDIFNARFDAMEIGTLRTIADWMSVIRDQPLEFEPGSKQHYSNAGYVILGAIIEKLSGETYYDYVRDHIFEPAGMTATDSYTHDERVPNLATGYVSADGARNHLPGRGSSAGGGYSTLDDLYRFAQARRAGTLGLAPAKDELGIAGGAPGVNAALEMGPDYTLIVLENLSPPAAEALAREVRGWLTQATGGPGGPGQARQIIRAGEAAEAVDAAQAPGANPQAMRHLVRGGGSDDPGAHPKRTVLPAQGFDEPMGMASHLPTLMVKVNGKGPYRFGLDTGGAGTCRVDSALAAELGLQTIGEVSAGDPSGKNLRTMKVVGVDSIEIGGVRFVGLRAPTRRYDEPGRGEPIQGVLGFGLFADGLLTLDYPSARVQFKPGALTGSDAGVLAFSDPHGIPQVTMDVAGHPIDTHIDAGSMGGFSLPEAMINKLALKSAPVVVAHARTVTNSFDIKGAPLTGTIKLGALRFADPMVEFQPLFPMANVGGRVLKDLRLTFDQKHHLLQLERPAKR